VVTKRFQQQQSPADDHVEFNWVRPVNGAILEWIDGEPGKRTGSRSRDERRWLVVDYPTKNDFEHYDPLKETPALFRTFADLEPTEPAFKDFARHYGQLGVRAFFTQARQLAQGESLARWRAEHVALRSVVQVIDALRSRRHNRLLTLAEEIPNRAIKRAPTTGRPEEIRAFFWWWIESEINVQLRARTGTGDSVVTLLKRDAKGTLALRQVPRSLLAALWLQCAFAVANQETFKQCASKDCRKWFLVSPEGGKRRQAIYCSRRCNVRAFRARPLRQRSNRTSSK
jgi:hypothetical protein